MITLTIDGRRIQAEEGSTVAVAMLQAGIRRESVTGAPREPACGMGTCWECRATVDGVAGVRTCLTRVTEGMEVDTRD
jgi:sarcosine oxidase subunit alpha